MLKQDLLDYFDEDYNHLGSDTHKNIHLHSLWHQSLNCWFINPNKKRFLIVQFSPDRTFMANKFDVAMFGVVLAGQKISSGRNDISARLHTDIPEKNLIKIGVTKEVTFSEDLGVLHKTFVHSYFVKKEVDLTQSTEKMENIASFFEMGIREGLDLFSGKTASAKMEGYDKNGSLILKDITYDDFVPRGKKYLYRTLFMINEWLEMDEWEQKYKEKWGEE